MRMAISSGRYQQVKLFVSLVSWKRRGATHCQNIPGRSPASARPRKAIISFPPRGATRLKTTYLELSRILPSYCKRPCTLRRSTKGG